MTKTIYKEFGETELTKLFDKINIFFYLCGMKDFWVSELKLPKKFVKMYDKFMILASILMILLIISNFMTIYIKNNLTQKQATDLGLLAIALPTFCLNYYTFLYYKTEVRDLLYTLVVILKEYYIDKKAETRMIREIKMYFGVFFFSMSIVLLERAVHSFFYSMIYGDIFLPYVTTWPDVNQTSPAGLAVRILFYVVLWFLSFRGQATYVMIISLLVIPTYQFRDTQKYFYSLDEIFKRAGNQEDKEVKYEEGLKRGIYMHALSLWCLRQCQLVCRIIFCGQMFITMCNLLLVLPPLLVIEGLSAKLPYVPVLAVILTGLAITMCNSGNITHEALGVSDAIYGSGWQNCYGMSSVKVRKLVVLAMLQAQQRIVLTAFGIIELSYENFVTIVKTAYSLFSVFY